MAPRTFISWICHFWARFWLNFNFGDFRAYFGYFSHVKIDFLEIYFQSWRIKLRVLKFFRPILIIKRHQKNTQAKLFEKFASRQHALIVMILQMSMCFIKISPKGFLLNDFDLCSWSITQDIDKYWFSNISFDWNILHSSAFFMEGKPRMNKLQSLRCSSGRDASINV